MGFELTIEDLLARGSVQVVLNERAAAAFRQFGRILKFETATAAEGLEPSSQSLADYLEQNAPPAVIGSTI